MVAGEAWVRTFENGMNKKFEVIEREETFKFGDELAESKLSKMIPINIGKLNEMVEVAVVKTNIPLLFSKEKLKEWGCTINFKDDTIEIDKTKEKIKMKIHMRC